MKICICGGGSLGHVIAGKIASMGENVSILTRCPEKWNSEIKIDDCLGKTFTGKFSCVTDQAEKIIPDADIVLLCFPGFAIESVLKQIAPYLSANTYVGSVVCCTGFFFIAYKVFVNNKTQPLFGFQRAPYIARVAEYGSSAHLLGYKKELQIATVNVADNMFLQAYWQTHLDTPVRMLDHFLEASLTNSNPLLHPARLYGLFHAWNKDIVYEEIPAFYKIWDDYSSELLISCDEEFHAVLSALPVKIEQIPTLLDYYESVDAESLTRKIQSITAFEGIFTPMKQMNNGYIPDFSSRYFIEDIPFGLLIIKSIAEILNVTTPTIDKILLWGQEMIGKQYMLAGKLNGKDLLHSGYVSPDLFHELIKK